jgi:hypothetical protein
VLRLDAAFPALVFGDIPLAFNGSLAKSKAGKAASSRSTPKAPPNSMYLVVIDWLLFAHSSNKSGEARRAQAIRTFPEFLKEGWEGGIATSTRLT